jgi:hypothetical protein
MRRITTASGSVYEVEPTRIRRLYPATPLRKDGDWIRLLKPCKPVVGEPMTMRLESLSEDPECIMTMRYTTPVTLIGKVERNGLS